MTINTQQVYTLQLNEQELRMIAQALNEKIRKIDSMLGGESPDINYYVERDSDEHKAISEEIVRVL